MPLSERWHLQGQRDLRLSPWMDGKLKFALTLTSMLSMEVARFWISLCVIFQLAPSSGQAVSFSKRWLISKAISKATCHLWRHADGFPRMWNIHHEVSLFLEDMHERTHDCDPIRDQTKRLFSVAALAVRLLCWCLLPVFAVVHLCLFGISFCLISVFSMLLCRVQFAQSDVRRDGLDPTVQRSVSATTGANVTPKLDSASVLKVSLVTGVYVQVFNVAAFYVAVLQVHSCQETASLSMWFNTPSQLVWNQGCKWMLSLQKPWGILSPSYTWCPFGIKASQTSWVVYHEHAVCSLLMSDCLISKHWTVNCCSLSRINSI